MILAVRGGTRDSTKKPKTAALTAAFDMARFASAWRACRGANKRNVSLNAISRKPCREAADSYRLQTKAGLLNVDCKLELGY